MLLIDGEDGIEGWLVDAAADVGLHVEEDFVQGQDSILFEVLDDGVDLEDLAVDVDLPRDVYSLEEVQAEAIDVFQIVDLLLSPVPQDALVPASLRLQQRNIPVGLRQVARAIFDLPQHLNQYLDALSLHYFLPY